MLLVGNDIFFVFSHLSSLPVSLHQFGDSCIFQHHHLININVTPRESISLVLDVLDYSEAVNGVEDHFPLIRIDCEVFDTGESPVYLSTQVIQIHLNFNHCVLDKS